MIHSYLHVKLYIPINMRLEKKRKKGLGRDGIRTQDFIIMKRVLQNHLATPSFPCRWYEHSSEDDKCSAHNVEKVYWLSQSVKLNCLVWPCLKKFSLLFAFFEKFLKTRVTKSSHPIHLLWVEKGQMKKSLGEKSCGKKIKYELLCEVGQTHDLWNLTFDIQWRNG